MTAFFCTPHHYCYEVTAIPLHELHRSEWMHCSYKNPDKLVHVLSMIFVGFIMTQHYGSPQNIINLRVCSKPVEPSNAIWLSLAHMTRAGCVLHPFSHNIKFSSLVTFTRRYRILPPQDQWIWMNLMQFFFPSVFMCREPSMWRWFRLLKEWLFQAVLYEETHYLCKFRRQL